MIQDWTSVVIVPTWEGEVVPTVTIGLRWARAVKIGPTQVRRPVGIPRARLVRDVVIAGSSRRPALFVRGGDVQVVGVPGEGIWQCCGLECRGATGAGLRIGLQGRA